MRRFFVLVLCVCLIPLPARALPETKYVALTFDDGPSGRFTRRLLDGLYDRGVKGTFLLCGYRIKEDQELTRRIFEEGHEIGLHGYSHRNMQELSRRDIAQEIMDTEALLPEGCRARFLRPPGGKVSDAVRQVAQARGLPLLGWSVDPQDWATDNTAAIEKAVLGNIKDGDIVLLHDMSHSSVQAALDIVDVLLKENYEIVTVSELARVRHANIKAGVQYDRFPEGEP